jgi:excisionase family DNA binding protein
MASERLLTVKQVAERLQMSPVSVQRWLRAGRMKGSRLPAVRLGWRIPESEVNRTIAEGETLAASLQDSLITK